MYILMCCVCSKSHQFNAFCCVLKLGGYFFVRASKQTLPRKVIREWAERLLPAVCNLWRPEV